METSTVRTAAPLQFNRLVSPGAAADLAMAIESSGVADDILCLDYIGGIAPRVLWKPEYTPLAAVVPDGDSWWDGYLLSALAMANTSKVGLVLMSDAIRRGPWFVQTMLTLAGLTEERVTLALGAGEAKNTIPYGYKRSEGLARLEDLLRIFNLLLECEEPVDFEGNIWNLRQAYLGTIRPRRPHIWAMGGGPKLTGLATQHADGFVTYVRGAFPTPERFADQVTAMKADLERQGRDPEQFSFGFCFMTLMHEDREVLERVVMRNALVRYFCGIFGRFHVADWRAEGFETVLPDNYHYSVKLKPFSVTQAEADEMVNSVSNEMVARSVFCGTPKEVASQVQEYIDAGATWVVPVEYSGVALPLDEAPEMNRRTLELLSELKGKPYQGSIDVSRTAML